MSYRQGFCVMFVAAALALGAAAISGSNAYALEGESSQANPASIRQALEQRLGQRAKVKLNSGQDLEGKVAEVGEKVVTIAELTGMEFYSATVRLDQVAAVIVRTPGK